MKSNKNILFSHVKVCSVNLNLCATDYERLTNSVQFRHPLSFSAEFLFWTSVLIIINMMKDK
jgi:hypothetical protein